MDVAVFEYDDGCGFAGACNSNSLWNLDVDKGGAVGLSWSVIIVVKRIGGSRREEVYGGQFKWAINKSKRNVKAMGCQREEAYMLL